MATERRRMFGIFQSFGGCPVIFLRYNPDSFKNIEGKRGAVNEKKRQEVLISWIKQLIKSGHTFSGCNVKFLFYDGYKESDVTFESITEDDVVV